MALLLEEEHKVNAHGATSMTPTEEEISYLEPACQQVARNLLTYR